LSGFKNFSDFYADIKNCILQSAAKKRIIVSVTSDLASDNRVHKICSTLYSMGFDVLLIGRRLPGSLPLTGRNYSTRRFRLLFHKGPLFYFCYNLRLFLFLLFSKPDLLLSNDLDTLPANFLVSRIKKIPLVYDSHEYFTEVPELVNRPLVKSIWEWLERKMVPRLKYAFTVCDSIAQIYTEKYGVPFHVVRNYPLEAEPVENETNANSEKIILYQGAVNMGRGLELAIRSMKYLEGARLVIAGDGDLKEELERLTVANDLQKKVQFTGRLSIGELAKITPTATVGLSLEEDIGLNYRYALPNKLFDYIQAQVPVLVTDLPEMAAVVRNYKIGETVSVSEPEMLAKTMSEMLHNSEKRKIWKQNLKVAARELIWEKEEKKVHRIFSPFL
jgi:glycosyltransferase involved in cell wall biosynthesis